MKIITCVKPVPDPGSRLVVNESRTWIKESNVGFAPSEADTYALEEALRIREKHEGEIVTLSMGGAGTLRVLRAALATGADRGIFLDDPAFEGSDELGTARVLAAAIRNDGGADLVLTGVQSDDLGTGTTGIMLAECLGWAHASVVIDVEIEPGGQKIRVRRELEGGVNERVELETPAVLTLQYGINQPRYPSLKGIMAAKKKEIKQWGLADLGLAGDTVGRAGARYEVAEVFVPERGGDVEILSGTPGEVALQLVEKLRKEAKVL